MPEERTQTSSFQGKTIVHFKKTAGFTAWIALASGVCGRTHEPVKKARERLQQDQAHTLKHFSQDV